MLARKLGHVLYQHPGYDGLERSETRRNEAQADAFALDIVARVGEPPMGMVPVFMLTAYADRGEGTLRARQSGLPTWPAEPTG